LHINYGNIGLKVSRVGSKGPFYDKNQKLAAHLNTYIYDHRKRWAAIKIVPKYPNK
jgi:hypothetical protein